MKRPSPATLFVVLVVTCATAHGAEPVPPSAAVPIAGPVTDARIEIRKAHRLLLLFSGDTLLRSYPIGLGFSPVRDKLRQGDGATPEGRYSVCVKNPNSRFLLSLGLNYPNRQDAARALARGLISSSQHDRIVRADQEQVCPPWNTPLGGEIFIHGRGSSSDWTLGCAALDDPDMRELYAAADVGTPVLITP